MFYYNFLESMICGDLMPHKIPEKNLNIQLGLDFISITNEYGYSIYNTSNYKSFIDEIPTDEKDLTDISFEKKVLKDLSGRTWFPPTKKAYYYSIMIDLEKSIIVWQYHSFFNEATNLEDTRFLVTKEIYKISVLAKDLQVYTNSQIEKLNNFDRSDSNHYVIYLLQETIIDLLQCLYKIFGGLLSLHLKNSKELRLEFFEGGSSTQPREKDGTRKIVHALFIDLLKTIYNEYNKELFSCPNENVLCEMFEKEMVRNETLKILYISKFYYLLHVMWASKRKEIKTKFPAFTKQDYLEPILKNCKLSFKTFNNKTIITNNLQNNHSLFKKEVDNFFK